MIWHVASHRFLPFSVPHVIIFRACHVAKGWQCLAAAMQVAVRIAASTTPARFTAPAAGVRNFRSLLGGSGLSSSTGSSSTGLQIAPAPLPPIFLHARALSKRRARRQLPASVHIVCAAAPTTPTLHNLSHLCFANFDCSPPMRQPRPRLLRLESARSWPRSLEPLACGLA